MLLLLPALLISLSLHESAHGYVANKLGDPTAKNLGRITLNPIKHFDPLGFLSMLVFKIGWANPVPINARNFKNPRRDMAISAAAGPISNLCLATVFTVLLRLVAIPIDNISADLIISDSEYTLYMILSVIAAMLYFGIVLNLNLMFFNLIPLPPFDGSRIAYVFLPAKTYFNIMRYEQYIMIGFIIVLSLGIIDLPLDFLTGGVMDLLFDIFGMPVRTVVIAINNLLNSLPKFNL